MPASEPKPSRPSTIRRISSRLSLRRRSKKTPTRSIQSLPSSDSPTLASTLQTLASTTTKLTISLSLDTLNGLEHQAFVAAQGCKLTLDNVKSLAPWILKACQTIEDTSEKVGVPIRHHELGIVIRVVKAVGEVVIQIPDLPDVEIPPLRNHLQAMLDGMREGDAQLKSKSKEAGVKSKSGSGDRSTKAQAKSKSKDASTKSKSGSGDKDPKVKPKSKGVGGIFAKSESGSKSKPESGTPDKLEQKKMWKGRRCL